jgi:hypothetical protein
VEPKPLMQMREVNARFGQDGVAGGEVFSGKRFEVRDRYSVLAAFDVA